MSRFVATIRFGDQGIKSIQETTRRAAAFKASAKKLGVKILDIYWCLGPFDGLLLVDAPVRKPRRRRCSTSPPKAT